MASLNKVILIGRLTRDPELRYTPSELAITEFSLAVDRRFKSASGEKTTDFFRCKAFKQTAEFVNNYLKKGNLVAVEGRIELNEFTGQDGVKKYFTDIVCDQVQSLSSREQGADGGGYDAAPSSPAPQAPARPRSAAPASAPPAAAEYDEFDDSDPFADE